MSRRLPSLHRPVLGGMGVLGGLALYYLLVWSASAILYVPIAIGLLAVLEVTRRLSDLARKRLDVAATEDEAFHAGRAARALRRSRADLVLFAVACLIGLAIAYLLWGPIPDPTSLYGDAQ
ncbi:hypothetical protein ABEB22_07680 [Thioclava sp. 'Guangxiensis']|uniref:hypothetical protein n=1 Tax=Thioclava sp. 'Guangxiensis' TaxID=3149044 RepID=UPI003877D7E9